MALQEKLVIETILPDFYRVEIPLPDNPLRALNSYIIKAGDRTLIIDTGMNRKVCIEAMNAALKELDIDLKETDFFITHQHTDHIGSINTFVSKSSKCYFNWIETKQFGSYTLAQWIQKVTTFGARHGLPVEDARQIVGVISGEDEFRISYPVFTPLKENDVLTIGDYNFRCIETPGHSTGHMCLYEPRRKLLVSGDHILGDITPNVSSWYNNDNPLVDYINSLDKIYDLDVELVLPGHRSTLTNFRGRIDELKHHHEIRANEILEVLAAGDRNVFQIASEMTWDMDYETWEQFPVFTKWFAFGEAQSHLQYLEAKGKVKQVVLSDENIVYTLKE